MMCQTGNGGRYGTPIPQVHRRVQAAGGGALPLARVHVRGARPRAGLRRGQHIGPGQEGGRREQAALEIVEYIECLYDRVRTHSALGYLSPEEFEARSRKGAARAA